MLDLEESFVSKQKKHGLCWQHHQQQWKKLLYANHFAGLDHEDLYTHLTKFYKITGTLGALENKEKAVFLRLFPHSMIGKTKEWYLNQSISMMTNWNLSEEKFLNSFFL